MSFAGQRTAILPIVTLAILLSLLRTQSLQAQIAAAQNESDAKSTVRGVVRDAMRHPVPGAEVSLRSGNTILTALTNPSGTYRFSGVLPGSYTICAKMAGFAEASLALNLGRGESQVVDLTLSPAPDDDKKKVAGEPQFFDEPHFAVAGVTDTTNLGGHGSSVAIVRNRESIEKATAGLTAKPDPDAGKVSIDLIRETNLRQNLANQPQSSEANFEYGKLLFDEGKSAQSISYLEKACRLNPRDFRSSYELARALAATGDYKTARNRLVALIRGQEGTNSEKADFHHLLAQVEEKLGNSLNAVKEFQRAAEIDPSETNLFDWGSDLLVHHAPEPASAIFQKGSRLFPDSVRMLVALGASWYSLGFFDKGAESLCAASDINPTDPEPYLFMGKMQATEAVPSAAVTQRLQRFLNLYPENALANYYNGVSLWKSSRSANDAQTRSRAKSLLLKSVQLDSKLAPGYLQLGIIYADEKNLPEAIAAFQKANAIDPDLEDAHYRIAQAYRQIGDVQKAQAEIQAYEKIRQTNAERIARERAQTKQFIYQMQPQQSSAQSQ